MQWSSIVDNIHITLFSELAGPKVPIPPSVLRIFSLFFTSALLQYIVDQSNKFALECMGEEKFSTWMKITVQELQAYMGFMVMMGLVKLPSLKDYWKRDEMFHYSPIASRISRDRFHDLHYYLHLVDNATLSPPGSPGYKKLGKIQPILDALCQSFQSVYSPGRNVSVDEAMIPFKGQSSLNQYMPKIPVKRGIKVWALADADNGYISTLEVYTGKEGDSVEKGLGAKVVKTLTSPYVNSHRHVYFDNFFTSIDLRKQPGRQSLSLPSSKRFCASHFPVRGADKVHRCHYCSKYNNKRSSTVWYCNDCQLFLCHTG